MADILSEKEIKELLDTIDEIYKCNYRLEHNGKTVTEFINKPSDKVIAECLLWVDDDDLNNMTVREFKDYVMNKNYTLIKK